MNNSGNRKIIKAKRKNKNILEVPSSLNQNGAQSRLHGIKNPFDSRSKLSRDSQFNRNERESRRITISNSTFSPDNVKRSKHSAEYDSTLTSNSNASDKYSANNRLQKYRVSLNGRKNEIVRVHQVLNIPSKGYQTDLGTNDLYPSKKSSLLGKRPLTNETDQNKQSVDYEAQNKKSKSILDTEIEKTVTNAYNIESHNSSDIFEMDWSPINETEIISNIQKFRESQRNNLNLVQEVCSFKSLIDTSCESAKNDKLYIVVDTNIFISHLHLIQDILSEEHVEHDNIIYVPWIVVQELDYFKDGRSGSPVMLKAARKAIKFINENLIKKHKRLKGQTVQEALSQKESTSNADDNILFCCINLVKTSNNVILLSNDVNLRNKALINNITSYGPKDILEKIKKMKINEQKEKKIDQITSVLTEVCTKIILAEMEEAYGSVLFNLITRPPWDFKQCLVYFKRFWNPVFSLVIHQKQCLKIIEDLLKFVQTCKDLATENNMEDFIKLCLSLCVYFKNCLNKYKKSVKTCIDNIQKILN